MLHLTRKHQDKGRILLSDFVLLKKTKNLTSSSFSKSVTFKLVLDMEIFLNNCLNGKLRN